MAEATQEAGQGAAPAQHAAEVSGGVINGADPLDSTVGLFLLQVVIIMATTRLLGAALSRLKQPRVIAEILAGIILGPSGFGNIPGWIDHVFPKRSLPYLSLVANVGLVLYMYLVGLELSPTHLFRNARHTLAISAMGIIVPFLLGSAGSVVLYQHRTIDPNHNVPFPSFLLFTGLSMSITAFPVLARILTDMNLVDTEVGVLTIGSAAIDDAVAWCLLILVISILHSTSMVTALYVFLVVACYGLVLLLICRPYISIYLDRASRIESDAMQKSVLVLTFMAIFLSSFFTEFLGVHCIFGAFLLGLATPQQHPATLRLAKIIEDFAAIVLLPLYFAASGLKTQIASLRSGMAVLLLFMVLGIATTGKFLGCSLAARMVKVPWREALTIGTLMNTRGLVELIVLNLGLDAKVIDVQLFTILVLMALVTTFTTSPVVACLYPPRTRRKFGSRPLAAATGIDTGMHEPAGAAVEMGPTTRGLPLPQLLTEDEAEAAAARERAAPSAAAAAGEEEEEEEGAPCLKRGAMKLMLVAQRMMDVPGLALLTQMLGPDSVSAVRFVESEEIPLSIIMSQGTLKTATRMDPTLQMVQTCGYLSGLPVDVYLKVCKSRDFARELCRRAIAEDCSMVLVPCRKQATSMGLLMHDYHAKFVAATVQRCPRTLLLFWDHQLGDQFLLHRGGADGGRKRVVVVFQGGANDRKALRIALRFLASTSDVALHVLVTQQAAAMALQDQEELAHFESCVAEAGRTRGVVIERYEDEPQRFPGHVLEACKRIDPQLIVLGSSEIPLQPGEGQVTQSRERRASVTHGAEVNWTKRLLSATLGQALLNSEVHASLLVVICPPVLAAAAAGSTRAISAVAAASARARSPSFGADGAAAVTPCQLAARARSGAAQQQRADLQCLHLVDAEDEDTAFIGEDDEEEGAEQAAPRPSSPWTLAPFPSFISSRSSSYRRGRKRGGEEGEGAKADGTGPDRSETMAADAVAVGEVQQHEEQRRRQRHGWWWRRWGRHEPETDAEGASPSTQATSSESEVVIMMERGGHVVAEAEPRPRGSSE